MVETSKTKAAATSFDKIRSARHFRLVKRLIAWLLLGPGLLISLAAQQPHWSLRPITSPPVPPAKMAHPIDTFIGQRLKEAQLEPSAPADRRTLIRRLHFDLHGLPPTPEDVEAFVNDPDPKAYEKLVERLLESQHYGERWARAWLDLARYSDTNGYEKDRPRSI